VPRGAIAPPTLTVEFFKDISNVCAKILKFILKKNSSSSLTSEIKYYELIR
jgi:hypothetical protein